MSDVEVSVKPEPAAVWDVLADVDRLDEWLPVHDEFEEDPPGAIEDRQDRHPWPRGG
jgi:carbon monoxide dehydrogenase subunit G